MCWQDVVFQFIINCHLRYLCNVLVVVRFMIMWLWFDWFILVWQIVNIDYGNCNKTNVNLIQIFGLFIFLVMVLLDMFLDVHFDNFKGNFIMLWIFLEWTIRVNFVILNVLIDTCELSWKDIYFFESSDLFSFCHIDTWSFLS